jgi:hypothetical protein
MTFFISFKTFLVIVKFHIFRRKKLDTLGDALNTTKNCIRKQKKIKCKGLKSTFREEPISLSLTITTFCLKYGMFIFCESNLQGNINIAEGKFLRTLPPKTFRPHEVSK